MSLILYDTRTEQWQPLAKVDAFGIGYPTWSHDGKWLYYRVGSGIARIRIADRRTESVVDLTNVPEPRPLWFGLTQDDSVLLRRDRSVHDVYALTLKLPR
jgi:hypothetical protein